MKRTWSGAASVFVVGVGVGVGVGGLAYFTLPVVDPPPEASPAAPSGLAPTEGLSRHATEAESANLRREVREMKAELARLQQQVAEASGPSRAAPQPAQSPSELRTPEARAEQERQWHQRMAEVEADYQAEPVDSTWATSTVALIHDTVAASEAMRGTVRRTECRSRTCKVEVMDDAGKLSKNLPLFVSQLGASLPSSVAEHQAQGDGQMLMTLYLSRELPTLATATPVAAARPSR